MDKGNKKRKLSHVEEHLHRIDDDDDHDEDQKIEKFYALIRSMREARDRLIMNCSDNQTLQMKQRKKLAQREENQRPLTNGSCAAWKPRFEREDFINNNEAHIDDDVGEVPTFKVPNSLPSETSSSSSYKIISSATTVPDQNQVQNISAKEPLDLTLSL
ncbi:NIM1-interacting protein [Trema orientale]|uniref:NIM1-interacting protein n=1 Tax=Trema orientale TaxID=63057 RepID=A0A2P5ET64_TREOI|nr:NIM1-interacting protein [Trema orientale]